MAWWRRWGSTPGSPSRRCRGSAPTSIRRYSAFRGRSLSHSSFLPYLLLDATYVKAHEGAQVDSKAIVIATGISASGERELLGLAVGDSEDGAFWTQFLRSLQARAFTR